jgi:hypothetical protein
MLAQDCSSLGYGRAFSNMALHQQVVMRNPVGYPALLLMQSLFNGVWRIQVLRKKKESYQYRE